jgi:hypothetical protein
MTDSVGFQEMTGIVLGATIVFIGLRSFPFARALSAVVSDLTNGRLHLH